MDKKKKFKLFDMNRDGKGVEVGEDRTPNLKFFFKQFGRKFSKIISLNILDGILLTMKGHDIQLLILPLLISLVVIFVIILMENTEMRIPVQRISIHNVYADKNYLAIKLNPIGIMPVMFAAAFFMLPQLFVTWMSWWFPNNAYILYAQENMVLTKPLGIIVYIFVLYILTIGFSRVMINPREMTDQFLKSGDSICDLHAGKETRKYLSRVINRMSLISATVMISASTLKIAALRRLTPRLRSYRATTASTPSTLTYI